MARTRKEIISDICDTYASLSPENLSCDGMLSPSAVRKEEARLTKRLNALKRELGEDISEMQAYDAMEPAR